MTDVIEGSYLLRELVEKYQNNQKVSMSHSELENNELHSRILFDNRSPSYFMNMYARVYPTKMLSQFSSYFAGKENTATV